MATASMTDWNKRCLHDLHTGSAVEAIPWTSRLLRPRAVPQGETIKKNVQQFWNEQPCGTRFTKIPWEAREFRCDVFCDSTPALHIGGDLLRHFLGRRARRFDADL